MRFIKFLIAVQIELIWWKIHFLRRKQHLSNTVESKIQKYRAAADHLGIAYEILSDLR